MEYLVQNDVGSQIKAVMTRAEDGSTVDLESATVKLKFRAKGSTTVLSTLTSIASADDAANGIAVFAFGASDLDVDAGKYEAEIESTFPGGNIETVYEIIDIYVRADF